MKQGYNSRLDESLGARNGKKTQSLKDRRDESKGAKKGAGKRAYSAVSTMDKPKKRQVNRTNKDGVKTKQVLKDGVVKKTVTRTKGGVEKEIERGKKRIDVRKYKDEGVKTRTVRTPKKFKYKYKDDSSLNKITKKINKNNEVVTATRSKDRYSKDEFQTNRTKLITDINDERGLNPKVRKASGRYKDDKYNINNRFRDHDTRKGKEVSVSVEQEDGKRKRRRTVTKPDQMIKDLNDAVNFMSDSDGVKTNIKNSSFARLPYNMVKEALKPENNVLPANQMDKMEQNKNQSMINMLNRESKKQRKENFS